MYPSDWHKGLFVLRSEVTFRLPQVIGVDKEPTQDKRMIMRLGIGDLASQGQNFWLFSSDDGR